LHWKLTCGPGHRRGWGALNDGPGPGAVIRGARLFGKTSGYCRRSVDFSGNHARRRLPAILADVFSATTGDRSRATHARSRPNNPAHRHISAAKLRALDRQEPATELRRQAPAMGLHRQEPAPRRLAVLYKPGPHRPAVQRRPVEGPALRTLR
jgi:hypothetical protein